MLDEACLDRAHLADRLAAVRDQDRPLTGVLSLLPLADRPGRPELPPTRLALSLVLAQALGDTGLAAPLWTLTRGAISTGPGDPLTNPPQAAVWGLGRVAALEHPQLRRGLVDLPAGLDPPTTQQLISALAAQGGEDQVAIRATAALGRRLVRHPAAELPPADAFTARGTVLVTGGTGALGAEVARWLARSGAEHSCSPAAGARKRPAPAELAAEMEELGARVTVVACDAADRDALAAVLDSVPAELPLTGVVHAAGVGQARPSPRRRWRTPRAMAAKLLGAANLDALLGDRELDFFVLFSSIAGVWGSAGQSAYGAANAYLDALAQQRRSRGLVATSVAWGPWADAGMATDEVSENLRQRGLRLLTPPAAIAELRRAIRPAGRHAHVRRRRLGAVLPDLHVGAAERPVRRGRRGTRPGRDHRRGGRRRRGGVRRAAARARRGRAGAAPGRPGARRGRRRPRAHLRRRRGAAAGLPRGRLRLADRRGAAQAARRR